MKTLFSNFVKNESGATAIEYGLIAGLISVAIIGAVTIVGGDLNDLFGKVSGGLNGTGTATTPTT
ncbi:MAG TPA: Flp family type IVb pilin [Paracoccaceae bacterium]|nr:Flp family type IVb pilin [Paracoccaceae bacterium]